MKKLITIILSLVMCATVMLCAYWSTLNNGFQVTKVIDGDTIVIDYNGKSEKVRLIGIDTPESVSPNESENCKEGIVASQFTKSKLEGKRVTLEFDVEQRDCYGRLLAYVYLDGTMFNKTLLEKGYATIYTFEPNVKYRQEFETIISSF